MPLRHKRGCGTFSGVVPDPLSAMNTERILLVDDSPHDNLFHEITLRKSGFVGELHVFECAEDALAFLDQASEPAPTLVLLDLHLPGMSGLECARQLEPLVQREPAFAVNVLTSSTWDADRRAAEALPLVDECLIKPLTQAVITRLLERLRARAGEG